MSSTATLKWSISGPKERAKRSSAGRAFQQELLAREQWGLARIALQRERLAVLEREYLLELALFELESLSGFPWTPEVSVPIN